MPVVSCPKCTAGLRVPDGSVAAVRCPKCQNVFQPPKPKPAAPTFEVVEAPPPRPAGRPPAPPPVRPAPPRPAPRPAPPPPAFEGVGGSPPPAPKSPPPGQKKPFSLDDAVRSADPPRTRRAARNDDRDRDDRDRRRDEDDDRRDRRRRDEDDYDDDDRRPRGRTRRERDDYDDDYDDDDRRDRGPARRPSRFGVARPGVLLVLISVGLYFGGMALHTLFLFMAWVGAVIPGGLVVITGILGLAGWVVGLVGFGMTIAGPPRARGLAIATTCVAVVHLVLAFVVANDTRSIGYGSFSIEGLSAMNRAERFMDLQKELQREFERNPNGQRVKDIQADLASYSGGRGGGLVITDDDRGGMRWTDMVTQLFRLDGLVAVLCYQSRGFEYYLLSLFAGLFELARLVLLGLLLGALARAAKAHRAEDQAKFGWIAGAAAVGIGLLVVILAAVLVESAAKDAVRGAGSGRAIKNYLVAPEVLAYTLHAGALVLPGLAALGVYQSMGRRR